MALRAFHLVISQWWSERFRGPDGVVSRPTSAQAEGWASIRSGAHTLIAAPTGSGKTLAAFLHSIDALLREGLESGLRDEVRVVYVSPLKALSADIHRNLAEPRREIRRLAEQSGLPSVRINAGVRTGDTPPSERAAMLKTPPHILVTTPESLYLLLTAERSRGLLRTVRTVIVDEIHAVIESRRGAHLSLSLERLDHVASSRVQRIGLSATQRPIELVGEYLVGRGMGNGAGAGAGVVEHGSSSDGVFVAGHASERRLSAVPGADEGSVAEQASERPANQESNQESTTKAASVAEHASEQPTNVASTTNLNPSPSPSPSPIPHPSKNVRIIDAGHVRHLDLALELPGSALEAVMSIDVWGEVYERLVAAIEAHRTTLVFVNTRRMAERVAANLADRLGKDAVMAHHGSLSKEVRQEAEERLKTGRLRALVATASLELGIDIGYVDLVCQLGSPRRISAFLQRVGRSGHTVAGTPKGRLFPLTRDDLVECAALLREVQRGELDRVMIPESPLDVLAQQVVAETAAEDWDVERLYVLFTRAYPYRNLAREEFDRVVDIVARGYATRRGRRGAFVHHDAVNGRVRGRRGARLAAITSGGAIPEIADYRVILEPEGTFLGTVNEDFAVESMAGDVFQLGNASWRILRVESGVMRVADAQGEPPSIPFWLGEAPSRSDELSAAVSALRAGVDKQLEDGPDSAKPWLEATYCISPLAAEQITRYLAETRRLLGAVPSQDTLVLERFFDEAGGMQLILHAPFGARVNRAWGLALRKKFCRTFNFELQAAATDEGLLLSLGPQHSFPLDDVFRYLHPNILKDTLVQAVLDAPLFQTRWRWNATLSLAVLRNRGGAKVPPPIQRMQAEDVLAAVFPDAAACLENIAGDREVPDHPLVTQALRDCLEEAMDLPRLGDVLQRVIAGELRLLACDTPEPSPLCHELLNARPYAFLDDAPLEERRAQAVYTRRALEPSSAGDLGALDLAAIERVQREAWPEALNADELHDALVTAGFLVDSTDSTHEHEHEHEQEHECDSSSGVEAEGWNRFFGELAAGRRAARFDSGPRSWWVAVERVPEMRAVHPDGICEPALVVPAPYARSWTREDALRELVRSRMEVLGPVTAAAVADSIGVSEREVEAALIAIEADGGVLRGSFTPGADLKEWCDRRLLARIHRYTLTRLRAEIQPVSMQDFMRFLFRWQRVEPERRAAGVEGLAAVIEQLDGFEVQGAAWEGDVLPARCEAYSPDLLDSLCMAGRVAWGRVSPPSNGSGALLRTSPIALMMRTGSAARLVRRDTAEGTSAYARAVLETLDERGASFFPEIVSRSGLLPTQVESGLAELAAHGFVTSDGFSGLRALLTPSDRRQPILSTARRRNVSRYTVDGAGRWARLGDANVRGEMEADIEDVARMLLRRWGVVFRRLLDRETNTPPWRDLVRVYRRMEAQGRIRGGRFVAGASGEQFALPEAVTDMRAVRRQPRTGGVVVVGAADPLNLTGIVLPGQRVPAVAANRIAFRDGLPVGVLEGSSFRVLGDLEGEREIRGALVRRGLAPELRAYLRAGGVARRLEVVGEN